MLTQMRKAGEPIKCPVARANLKDNQPHCSVHLCTNDILPRLQTSFSSRKLPGTRERDYGTLLLTTCAVYDISILKFWKYFNMFSPVSHADTKAERLSSVTLPSPTVANACMRVSCVCCHRHVTATIASNGSGRGGNTHKRGWCGEDFNAMRLCWVPFYCRQKRGTLHVTPAVEKHHDHRQKSACRQNGPTRRAWA